MRAWLIAMLVALFGATLAHAEGRAYLTEYGYERPLRGWVEFCETHSQDCFAHTGGALGTGMRITLGDTEWRMLREVNNWVNQNVKPLPDPDHWGVSEKWSYPDDGYGDCEDYVLLKRRMLIEMGWPREVLRITMVFNKQLKDKHAVLTVPVTDEHGRPMDLVLDNLWLAIETVDKAAERYDFLRRQKEDPMVWVSLVPPKNSKRVAKAAPAKQPAEKSPYADNPVGQGLKWVAETRDKLLEPRKINPIRDDLRGRK